MQSSAVPPGCVCSICLEGVGGPDGRWEPVISMPRCSHHFHACCLLGGRVQCALCRGPKTSLRRCTAARFSPLENLKSLSMKQLEVMEKGLRGGGLWAPPTGESKQERVTRVGQLVRTVPNSIAMRQLRFARKCCLPGVSRGFCVHQPCPGRWCSCPACKLDRLQARLQNESAYRKWRRGYKHTYDIPAPRRNEFYGVGSIYYNRF